MMSFAYILTVLMRRWRIVVATAVIGAAAGVFLAELTPTRYSASTSLVVSPLVTNPFATARDDVNIRTEREVLGSREVATRASEMLGESLETSSYLISHVDVAAPSGSQILQVNVQAGSPEQAAAAADALSQAYLEFRSEGANAIAQRYLDNIDEQLAELAGQPETAATSALSESLQQQRITVLLSTAEPGRIIGGAVVPTAPSTPSGVMMIIAGTMLGILLGGALALVRERMDRRVSSVDRLELAIDAPIVEARSLADGEAWEEVALVLERTFEADENRRPRILIDSLGQAKDAALGEEVQSRLAAALSYTRTAGSVAGTSSRKGFQWQPILNGCTFSFADLTSETSRGRVIRVARTCDVAVHIVSRTAALEGVGDAVARVKDAGVVPVVVFLADWRVYPSAEAT